MTEPLTPDAAISALRAHVEELRSAGIRHLGLFGSLARGELGPASDVDLVAELDPEARVGVFRLLGLERRLAEILGRSVDLLPEPIEHPRLRVNVERDRRVAF
jgi:predicted nucleotidyltransferase